MSEHQVDEFLALDRPLTDAQMRELRAEAAGLVAMSHVALDQWFSSLDDSRSLARSIAGPGMLVTRGETT